MENGVSLAGCDHAEGEKSGCQDFLSLSHTLSFLSTFSSSLFSSLSFSISASKRRVAEISFWAGLRGPPLKAELAKKRGGGQKERVGRRKIEG